MKKTMLSAAIFLISAAAIAGNVILAENGKTSYQIVLREDAGRTERAAASDLGATLKTISGADFSSKEVRRKIWIGKTAPSDKKPLAQNERRIRIDNGDLYIYGQGEFGNINAVYDFLKDIMGCRWFTFYGVNRIPKQKRIVLADDLAHAVIPSIPYMTLSRALPMPAAVRFARRNALHSRQEFCVGSFDNNHAGQLIIPSGLIPFGGKVGNIHGPLKYFKDKAYFKTDPDFFAMDKKGRRVTTMQLCYTNPRLRDEYEKNIKFMLETEKYRGGMKIIGVGQDDNGGAFCYCPTCKEAENRHDHPAGPYYDFLYDLGKRFEKSHPELLFCFLAYRDDQTLRPSRLITKLPDNLLPSYAPLGVDFSKPISHPINGEEDRNFTLWAKVADKMSWWSYPTPYPRPIICYPLIANINRIAENFRVAHRNKVWMAYCEFGSGAYSNLGFNDLRTYMLSVLCRNINADVQTIIREFTDACYGPAAADMRRYLAELEELEAAHATPLRWNPSILSVEYATPENLLRWQKLFDRMESAAGNSVRRLLSLRRARFSLDETTIAKWPYMTAAQRSGFGDLETIIKRAVDTVRKDMTDTYSSWKRVNPKRYRSVVKYRTAWLMSGLEQYIAAARGGKPLPEFFDGKKVYRIMPDRNKLGLDVDPEAAFGLCNTGVIPRVGPWLTYRSYRRDRSPKWISRGLPKPVTLKRVQKRTDRGKYNFYYLGRITLEPDAQINFTNISRISSYAVGHLFDPAVPGRLFDLYVSMAVDLKSKKIRQDQLVLVEAGASAAPAAGPNRLAGGGADTQDMFQ